MRKRKRIVYFYFFVILRFLDSREKICKQECLPDQYTNHFSSTCEPCNSLTCPQSGCPEFQYQIDEGCFDCPKNCTGCRNNQTCIKCKTSFYMAAGQCLQECPLNYYTDYEYHKCDAVPVSLDGKKGDPYFYSLINIGKNTDRCSNGQLIQITFLEDDPIIIEYFHYSIYLINQQSDTQIYPPLKNHDYEITMKQNQSNLQICISTNLTLLQNQNLLLKIQNDNIEVKINFDPPISTFLILSTLDDTKDSQISNINDYLHSNSASTSSLIIIKSVGAIGLLTNIFQALALPLLQHKVMPPQSYEMARLLTQFIQLDTLPEFYDQQKEEYVAFFVINVTEEVFALNYNSTAQQLGLQPIILYTLWNIHIFTALFFLALLVRRLIKNNVVELEWKEFQRDSFWQFFEMFIESNLISIIVCLIICFQFIKNNPIIICFLYSIGLIVLWTRNTYVLYKYSQKRDELKRLGDLQGIQEIENHITASYRQQLANTKQGSFIGIMAYQINLMKKIILIFINVFMTEYPFEQNILSAQFVLVFLIFSFQYNVQKQKMQIFISYFDRIDILNCFEQISLVLFFLSIAMCAYKYNSLQFAIEQEVTEIQIYIEQWQSCGNLVNYLIIQTSLISSIKAITLIIRAIMNFLIERRQAEQQQKNVVVEIESIQSSSQHNVKKTNEIELDVSQVQEQKELIKPQQMTKQNIYLQNQALKIDQERQYRPEVVQVFQISPPQQKNKNFINQFNIGNQFINTQPIKRPTTFNKNQGSMPAHYPPGLNPYLKQYNEQ